MSAQVLTVTQLNTYIKMMMEADENLQYVLLAGEISNFTNHYRTGHYYMTLKDANAAVKAVMFRSANQRLRFMPENGMKVLVRGRVSLYERDGQYQVYVEDMQPDGVGDLTVAFEQLKRKLEAKGYFDAEAKKPIPPCPMRVGIITSPTGAAVQDILQVLGRRFPMAQVVFCPVQVQGASAAGQIAAAIEAMNDQQAADVLIVGRGGGSIEDLWAFNEELVAKAVYNSEIPVISAVGHETDFTICDFVADLRAPTPSAAAELAVPEARTHMRYLQELLYRLQQGMWGQIAQKQIPLEAAQKSLSAVNPKTKLANDRQYLDNLSIKAEAALRRIVSDQGAKLASLAGRLDTMSPLRVLSRGYAIAAKDDKAILNANSLQPGDTLSLQFHTGSAVCTVETVEG